MSWSTLERRSSRSMVLARVRVGVVVFACFMAVSIQSLAGEVPFAHGHTVGGNWPKEVFPVDLDRDGDVDLAVADYSSHSISWYENTAGDGSAWTQHNVYTHVPLPTSVSAADLDRDGDIDLVSTSENDGSIRWYENIGGSPPTFDPTPHVLTSTMSTPRSVVAGDLDRDGDVDLVACSEYDNDVSWFENDGATNPSFTRHIILHDSSVPAVPDAAADDPMAVHLADVNGDGAMDILWASRDHDGKVGWLENNGMHPPAFSVHTVSVLAYGAEDVWAADVDGDGDIDILASTVYGWVFFYRNVLGDGTSWSAHTVTSNSQGMESITAGDVDGDGDIDALAAAFSESSVIWYENTAGNGLSWTARTISSSAGGPNDAALADLDGDGDLDVAAAPTGGSVFWLANQTIHRTAYLDLEHVVTTNANGANCVRSADLDGDGDPDLVVSSFWDKWVRWYQNNGAAEPSFIAHGVYLAGGSRYTEAVSLADLDGDGDIDVIGAYDDWVTHTDNAIYWFANNGSATPGFTPWTVSTVPDGPVALDTADIDGDGDTDVVSGSMYDDTLRWYRSNGGFPPLFTALTVHEDVYDPMTVWAADMANHGEVDIVSATRQQDIVFWLWNDGATTPGFVASDISYAEDAPRCVCTADIDSDGLLDVISGSENSDELAWFSNNGWGSLWAGGLISTSLERVMGVAADDLDRDGDIDVVATGYDSDEIAWFEQGASAWGTWSPHSISTDRNGPRSVVIADLDRDGDLDVASASYNDDTVAWYENRGGQYSFDTHGTAPASMMEGKSDDVLRITLAHDGRTGDTDVEFATMVLRFDKDGGLPMTTGEANAVIDRIAVYIDSNGSGVFEAAEDSQAFSQGWFSLIDGRSTFVFPDGDASWTGESSWRVKNGSPKTYFVVVQLTSDAASAGIAHFLVIHGSDPEIGTPVSTIEDWDHDIVLDGRYAPDVGGSWVTVESALIFEDGFESGNTSEWSLSVP